MELHPLSTLFPRMTGYDFDCLTLDIKENGLREPIITYQGMILDGGNRFEACKSANITPVFKEFSGDNIVTFVLSANLHRRHLSPGQQAAIVASAQDWATAQPAHRPKKGCNVAPLSTSTERSKQSGASIRTQKTADKIAKVHPELAKSVGRGEISLPQAEKQAFPKSEKEYDPKDDALADAHETVIALSDENQQLKDAIAVGKLPESEQSAGEIIKELRSEVKILSATISVITIMRDSLLRENKELKDQCAIQRKIIKKLEDKK
jgi:ParB-like chromosome segregation protein Spo0J